MSGPATANQGWRGVLLKLGARPIARWIRYHRAEGPTLFANFLFQRILRVNAECPWSVHFTSRVTHSRRIEADPSVHRSFALSGGCYIQAFNGIRLGRGVLFAPGVKMISANHHSGDLSQWESAGPIDLGEDCWVGANAVILPGVQLGPRVTVGAGSVVTDSFEHPCIIAGVPARLLRNLDPRAERSAAALPTDSA